MDKADRRREREYHDLQRPSVGKRKEREVRIEIDSIRIKQTIDENPDLTLLGEFTDDLGPGVLVRALGNFYEKLPAPMERHADGRFYAKGAPYDLPRRGLQYRGFIPYAGGEKPGTKNYYKYGLQDWERIEGLESGAWCFIGIRAVATVRYQTSDHPLTHRLEQLSSPGIWGVESDAGDDYIMELAKEELAGLKEHLATFGVDLTNFDERAEEALERIGDW